MTLAWISFLVGAVVSLLTSWVLVTRLERVGERVGMSEALLGVVAALAADAPEITSSISALSQHQRAIGAGVVIGSNVFNLAALLGLGAVTSGFIGLHRRVVALGGVVGIWVAIVCVAASARTISVGVGLALASVVLVAYVFILGSRRVRRGRLPLPTRAQSWLVLAVEEEELELLSAIRPKRGRPVDALVALVALIIVVGASVEMERGASRLGAHFHIADAVIGGAVLAAVTSLPNAVAAVHLASKGRGAAALSTTLSSNNLNVIAGLLLPGLFVGLAVPSTAGLLTAWWYVGLTVLVLGLAYLSRGLRRIDGLSIIAGYLLFVVVLLVVS